MRNVGLIGIGICGPGMLFTDKWYFAAGMILSSVIAIIGVKRNAKREGVK